MKVPRNAGFKLDMQLEIVGEKRQVSTVSITEVSITVVMGPRAPKVDGAAERRMTLRIKLLRGRPNVEKLNVED